MRKKHQTDKGAWVKDLRLYVHVPFCVKKCDYCDFLSGPSDEKGIEDYFNALYKEIRSYKSRTDEYVVSSIFIGGGTPSCVESKYISRTLMELKNVFSLAADISPEITIEVNPGTIDKEKLIEYKNAGINRISFGLQSADDKELRFLGRIHSYSEFENNYLLARELGFDNINIDLISSLPGQSIKSWENTLLTVAKLNPEHISAYSLIIEEGTPFYDLYGPEGIYKDRLMSEEDDRIIYKMTKEILSSCGYNRYEISNYAKPGYICRHNMAYWEGESYLGIGLGSASYIDHTRFNNTGSLIEYLNINELIGYKHNIIMSTNNENTGLLHDFFE